MKKENFFIFYILVSLSILLLAFVNSVSVTNRIKILGIVAFFLVALKHHFHEVKSSIDRSDERKRLDYENVLLVIGTGLSAAITWYINHKLGFGPIIANGLVGIVVGLFFFFKDSRGLLYGFLYWNVKPSNSPFHDNGRSYWIGCRYCNNFF